ncbi:MAG TPA: sulfotransferase [Steroidobacteraceae bacterium]|nr:sulfotransferase [Steroidobacteraceae bacterium]
MPLTSDPEVLVKQAQQEWAGNQLSAAEAKCLAVLGAHRHHPGALEVLGCVLNSQGRYEDAVRVFNALTLMQPTVAAHWQHLGTVLRPAKRYDQALAAFERALRLGAPTPMLLYNLGVLQMDRCDFRAAHLALRDGMALAPKDAALRWAFARCSWDLGRPEEALAALDDWQDLEDLGVEFTVLILLLLARMGAIEQAQPALARLLANPPQQGPSALRVAVIFERLHRLDEARALLSRLERNDRSTEAVPERLLLSAALAERAGQHEEAYGQLAQALQGHQEFVHRHHLLFPYARVCDALGRYEEAYAAAEEAHRSQLQFLELATGETAVENLVFWSASSSGCDPQDVATWANEGPSIEDSPIFIVGFPRSGTTLLEQVLDAHPGLKSMDEQPLVWTAVTELAARGIRYPAELGLLSAQDLDEIRAHYWERARKRSRLQPGQRLVDKNPLNLTLLPMMRRLFPQASIILAIRHPCDTLLSCFLQHFGSPGLAVACRDLTTLARSYSRAYGYWYAQWPLLRPSSYELRYESLTTDFAVEVRKLAAFLQLPWHEAMLAPGKHAREKGFISTPSYAQVTEPVSSRSVGRWTHYQQHFAEALAILAPWIERWGY